MPRGRVTTLTVRLTTQERQTLQAWQLATSMPVGLVRRGRLLLLLAGGLQITQVARTLGLSRRAVYKWVRRFQAQGVEGLTDRRRGHLARRQAAGRKGPP